MSHRGMEAAVEDVHVVPVDKFRDYLPVPALAEWVHVAELPGVLMRAKTGQKNVSRSVAAPSYS